MSPERGLETVSVPNSFERQMLKPLLENELKWMRIDGDIADEIEAGDLFRAALTVRGKYQEEDQMPPNSKAHLRKILILLHERMTKSTDARVRDLLATSLRVSFVGEYAEHDALQAGGEMPPAWQAAQEDMELWIEKMRQAEGTAA